MEDEIFDAAAEASHVARAIEDLKAANPDGYERPNTRNPRGSDGTVKMLPKVDVDAITHHFKESEVFVKGPVTIFLRSGGVLPQVSHLQFLVCEYN